MHLSISCDVDLRTEKALGEEFWKWIVLANGCVGHPLHEASRDACQPEIILDWGKIKRLRLKRGIYEIDTKLLPCLSQDSFVVCLMPVLAQKYGLY